MLKEWQMHYLKLIDCKSNNFNISKVEEILQVSVTRKFEDSLQIKSVSDLTQCLGIFYSLGRLSEILELKCNQIIKQISEQYKILQNSKSFLPDYRNRIKNELNQMILIWLIYQAINQSNLISISADQYHLITITSKIHFYPIIKDIYYDQLIMFSEQILIFPLSILLSLNLNELLEQMMSSLIVLKPLHQMQFILLLKEQIKNLVSDVYVQERGQTYIEKALNTLTSFIDFIKLELEQIKNMMDNHLNL
ncbi:unnamed protein product [Paramecium sonneborni]|nr:unnamed protein product [Paramecium sonneborni]